MPVSKYDECATCPHQRREHDPNGGGCNVGARSVHGGTHSGTNVCGCLGFVRKAATVA